MLIPFYIFFLFISVNGEDSLRFVHAIWRHGDRSSAHVFATDTLNNESSWPQGFGELSTEGMRQHFALGEWMRRRYNTFISDKYSRYEIYIRSTDYNRTIMSAQSNMAGFYFPHGEEIWNPNIFWQPIPIHTRPREEDPMLWMDKKCPYKDKLYAKVQSSETVLKLEKENEAFLKFLGEKTGMNKTLRLDDMWLVFDPLNCERLHNDSHKWPQWVNSSVFEKIVQLHDWSTFYYYFTPEIQRLRGGLLLGDILHRMQWKAANPDLKLKFYVYSAHDTTLGALLSNLGAIPEKVPTYASAILIELHEKSDNWFVQVYFKNLSMSNAVSISIGDCPSPCSLQQFQTRSESRIPPTEDAWYSECGLRSWFYAPSSTYLVIICILLSIIIFLLPLVVVRIIINRRNNRNRYDGRMLMTSN